MGTGFLQYHNMTSRYSSGAHQRDARTQLFGGRSFEKPARVALPYDLEPAVLAKHNEAFLMSLESQNNDEVDTMLQKVAALKNLGQRMGTEINKLMQLNADMSNSFEQGRVTLKNTYNRMVVMSQRAGITWRMWAAFFGALFVWFFYIWLF